MYGSRKVNGPKVKFAKTTWDDRLKGVGFVSVEREEPQAKSPVAPPSPSPPSPAPPSPLAAEFEDDLVDQMKEDEFTRHAREQTKAQLESITGRMFQVLNDFEGDGSNESGYFDMDDQLNSIPNSELKANIQIMIADYKDMCVEREELLHSLADWFDEGHIDDIMEDMKHRRKSVAADPEGLRKSLLEGKVASQKLKALNDQIETAKDQGLPVDHLEDKKAELEKEVMKSAKLMEKDVHVAETNEDVSTKVKDSWKFAAVEIYSLINQVRENGLDDVHEMEAKMRALLSSMNQQSEIIDKLSSELKHQKQVVAFSDMTTTQLSGDNSLLKDEVEMLRGELIEANENIKSLRSEIRLKTLEADRRGKTKQSASKREKRTMETDMARLELRVSQLTDENTSLQQENQDLLMACGRLERDLEIAKDLFDEEVAGHKAELQVLNSSIEEHRSMSRQISMKINEIPAHERESSAYSKHDTESSAAGSSHEQTRKVSAKLKSVIAERRTSHFQQATIHHSQDVHLFAKLADKENQLKNAKQELVEARGLVHSMENEVEKLKRENAELVKLQEKSAALINQASTCLQIKSESSEKTSQHSARVQQPPAVVHQQSPHSVVQTNTVKAETVFVQSSDTARSVSHSHNSSKRNSVVVSNHEPIKETALPVEKAAAGQTEAKPTPDPNVWSVFNSFDDGSSAFGMPLERSSKEKQADSLQLVMELIDKVNAQQSDFATADSKALKQVHTELIKVSQLVRNFLEYSTTLINDEAEVVSHAVDSLMEQLPTDEKPDLDGPMPPTGEKPNRLQQQRLSLADTSLDEQKRLKEKAVHFADQAIEVLKAGERMLTTKINTQQKRLHTVLHAMEDHRRRQSQCFKFEAPDSMGLVLEAHGVSKHNIAASQQQPTQRKDQSVDNNRRERLERLRRYTGNRRTNANSNLFLAFMRAGRFGNQLQGFGGAFPKTAEDSDDLDSSGVGFGMGISGYGGGYGGRHTGQSSMADGLAISPQANNPMQQEGTISLKFGSNVGTYQRHHPQQESADQLAVSNKTRKKAGKLYKPFHSSSGANNSLSRRDRSHSRQGQAPGQRTANSNMPQLGRKWESSNYGQHEYRNQDGGSRNHNMSGATFYDLLKHGTRSSRARQQTVTLLGDNSPVKLPPI